MENILEGFNKDLGMQKKSEFEEKIIEIIQRNRKKKIYRKKT